MAGAAGAARLETRWVTTENRSTRKTTEAAPLHAAPPGPCCPRPVVVSYRRVEQKDVGTITKSDCLEWAAKFAKETCATAFNNTVSVLRRALDIVVELGIRYDTPPRPSNASACVRKN